jgi:hypothetical protein
MTRLKVTTDEEGHHQVFVDEEPVNMLLTGLEIKVTAKYAEVTMVTPLDAVELDIEAAELNLKVKGVPEDDKRRNN